MFSLRKENGWLSLECDGVPVPVDSNFIEFESPDAAAIASLRPLPFPETIAHRIIRAQIAAVEHGRECDLAFIRTLKGFLESSPARSPSTNPARAA